MSTLRDPFAQTYEKGGFTYVSWSQVADRLDEAAPGWSFAVVQMGEDWCLGRLTLGDRVFENVGYAENADANWKHEVLKDAVSDALKRCAALAGVARYLYDKEPTTSAGRAGARPAAPTPRPTSAPPASGGGVPEEPAWVAQQIAPVATNGAAGGECPVHHLAWMLRPGGVSPRTNKAYGPFWSCPSTDRPYCTEKPAARWTALHEVAS